METTAVVLKEPEELVVDTVSLLEPTADDVVVDVHWSGISTGTERLLYTGRMPPFPGMGYPLVPGYESVGTVVDAGSNSGARVGDTVFVPGARCFGDVRSLFGGTAKTLVVKGERAVPLDARLRERGALMALAATAYHAISAPDGRPPELIVGHGVLGRLLARLTVEAGNPPPVVWEADPARQHGGLGYAVTTSDADERRDYRSIYDVSGDAGLLDTLIGRLAPGGEVVLAGFYGEPLGFNFAPAFMREARIRVAAEWRDPDLAAVKRLVETDRLSLDGLITHSSPVRDAKAAYETAFSDTACLKMILDWSANA